MSIIDENISIIDNMQKKPLASPPDFFSTQVLQARCFYLNLKPPAKEQLTVVCGGVEHCAPDYAIQRLTFPFYSVEFVAQGAGTLKLTRSKCALQAGSIFAYGPGISHSISTDKGSPMTKYFIDFSGREAAELLKKSSLRSGTVSQVFPPAEIQPLFEELVRNGLRRTRQSPRICTKLLEALLLKVKESKAPLPGRETLAFTTYQKCRNHIDRHFLRLRSLQQIASECHVDDAYLCRLFKNYDHETPYHHLIRLKMIHAAGRLPGIPIKQIAEETGFMNPFHFSRVFKSVFGASPRALTKMR